MAVELHPAPLTCIIDGLAHTVSDEAAVAGLTAGRGIYTALCGHSVHAAAMICSAGQPCPRCAQYVKELLAPPAEEEQDRRWAWLWRLFRRSPGIRRQTR